MGTSGVVVGINAIWNVIVILIMFYIDYLVENGESSSEGLWLYHVVSIFP